MSRRPRWGDTLDEEDLLPPPVVKGPDDNGVKTITEYVKNDKGETIKRTSKIKVVTVEKKVYKVSALAERAFHCGRQATRRILRGSGLKTVQILYLLVGKRF